MKIDLSVVPEQISFEHIVPPEHLTGRSLYSRYESSSGSYQALLKEDGMFHLRRLETQEYPEVSLGKVPDEARARRLLDWWVKNDRRMKRVLKLEALGWEGTEGLLDLICDAAHAC